MIDTKIGNDWDDVLHPLWRSPSIQNVLALADESYNNATVYPPKEDIFNALKYTPFNKVRVVILGQDPYINPNQAHGLAFSVKPDSLPLPPSLVNIFVELKDELGCQIPNNGYLVPWAEQGVLLLNTILTVDAGKSHSHRNIGWQKITDYIISALSATAGHSLVFMLWGNHARSKAPLIETNSHLILQAPHPSPLAGGKFFGCNHFIQCNNYLYEISPTAINWQIPDIERK